MGRFKWLGWPNIRLKMYKAEKNYPEPIDCVNAVSVSLPRVPTECCCRYYCRHC